MNISNKDDGPVSKPVLGRKLGTLLKREAGKDVNPTLLRGPSAPPGSGPPRRAAAPRWYWLGADLLLVAFALLIMFKGPAPLSATRCAFGIGSIVLGAGLAIWTLRGDP